MAQITIIIPTYQSGHMIAKALDSVKAQTIPDWELVVVDDASKDSTGQVIHNFTTAVSNKVIYIKNNIRLGVAACRNIGLKNAKGEFVAFLDADDFWEKNHLEKGLATLTKGADFCYSGFYIFDRNSEKILNTFKPDNKIINNTLIEIFKRSFIQTSSCAILSRKLVETVGKFDEKFLIGEDWDYWIRALLCGFTMRYSGYVTCYYNKHGANIMYNTLLLSENVINFYHKYLDSEKLPRQLRKKYYAKSLFNHARLIRSTDPQGALNEFTKAWKIYPLAFHYIVWILYTGINKIWH
ncbi:MAG: glycosyltransferase [Candidatus Omnitrophota bacterium]